MVSRRRLLTLASGALLAAAGCVGDEEPSEDGDTTPEATETRDRDGSSTRFLIGAPVEGDSEREPVFSSAEEPAASFEPLQELVTAVTETFETESVEISAREAEQFEEITSDVEQYPAGNPPGYYVDHEGRTVSVRLQ